MCVTDVSTITCASGSQVVELFAFTSNMNISELQLFKSCLLATFSSKPYAASIAVDFTGLGDGAEQTPVPMPVLVIAAPCLYFLDISLVLSGLSDVIWVEEKLPTTTFNQWARGVVQMGVWNGLPLYAANLTGRSEIVGIADTGIDQTSCFFRDGNKSFVYNKLNMKHRKVVWYSSTTSDLQDDAEGHGT